MKSHIAFDTLEFTDDLKKGGFKQEEAEAVAKATAKAFTQMIDTKELATKKDILELKIELKSFIGNVIIGSFVILAGVQTLLHFFPGK